MNFNAPLFRPVRMLLFPFSLVYGLIVWIRNKLFDIGFFPSTYFNLPVICVGNLSAGGTGKSPLVEFLIASLQHKHRLAVLSRGYKRKTAGYALANTYTTALEIGDEPMQFFLKYPEVAIAVGEERVAAIPQLLHDRPETEVVILDDAFQHRAVSAGLNILLTDYNNLFTRDWFLPTGELRDSPSGYKRADLMVVTKCRASMNPHERSAIVRELCPLDHQEVFFTTIAYNTPYHIVHRSPREIDEQTEVLLVTGIANPASLKNYLAAHSGTYYEILYGDHHIFSIDDWKEITKRFDSILTPNKIILTTEKDAVRLAKFSQSLRELPVYVIPIQVKFLFNGQERFTELIGKFIEGFAGKTHINVKEETTQKK